MIEVGILFGILAMLCWGINDFFASIVSKKLDSYKAFFWMQLFGLIVLSLFYLFVPQDIGISVKAFIFILFAAVMLIFATISFFKGLSVGKVSIIGPIGAGWAIITVILSLLLFNESISGLQVFGIVLIVLGTILVSFKYKDLMKLKITKTAKGIKYGVFALVGWGLLMTFTSMAVKEAGWFFPVFLTKLISVGFLLIYFTVRKQSFSIKHKEIILPQLLVGILSAVAFLLYAFGVSKDYTSIVAPVSASYPAVTVILARIFLKEKLEVNQYIGVLIIVFGVIILSL